MKRLVQEVRWELSIRGAKDVKIIVSGGINEEDILDLRDYVDGFGVGSIVAAASPIDFSDKIVQVEEDGKPTLRAKRGDLGGKKNVYRNMKTFTDVVTMKESPPGRDYKPLLTPLIRDGEIVRDFPDLDRIRERTARIVKKASETEPVLNWD